MRLHRKVWLVWGPWWAVQFYAGAYLSVGAHLDLRRPYLDLHVLWFIISLGRLPVLTNELDRHRHTCRGFLFRDSPLL